MRMAQLLMNTTFWPEHPPNDARIMILSQLSSQHESSLHTIRWLLKLFFSSFSEQSSWNCVTADSFLIVSIWDYQIDTFLRIERIVILKWLILNEGCDSETSLKYRSIRRVSEHSLGINTIELDFKWNADYIQVILEIYFMKTPIKKFQSWLSPIDLCVGKFSSAEGQLICVIK